MADIPGNSSTTVSVTVGSTTNGTLETIGDRDWYKITLSAGQSITVTLNGVTLEDPYLIVRNSSGSVLYYNDDNGDLLDSQIAFTATTAGTYYIDVGAFDDAETGSYQLVVSSYTPPPIGTVDDFADQLITDFWVWSGSTPSHFNVTQGGVLTVDLTGLTAEGRTLAREALQLWSDIIDVTFQEVSSNAQITFDDNEPDAWSESFSSGGFTTSAHVNVSIDWLDEYGDGTLTSYAFQTYVHEIGHALGLGHAGDYDGVAAYPTDARYSNDSWALSIMSYFDQDMNTHVAGQGFTFNYAVTPMIADIYAMSLMYGLSTTTRLGNTTYGSDWHTSMGAIALFDSGGTDTIDVSSLGGDQLVDLNPGTFSNVMDQVGNVSIAIGTIIENARSGSGADTLIGNQVDNSLESGAGNDLLKGGSGNDTLNGGWGSNRIEGGSGRDTVSYAVGFNNAVTVNLSTARASNGTGTDTLVSIENVTGSTYNDVLTGSSGDNVIDGHLGNDVMNGGSGIDTAAYVFVLGGVSVDLSLTSAQNTGGGGTDTLSNFENLLGSEFGDTLRGNSSANIIDGAVGSDVLFGGGGEDRLIGGAGDDTLDGGTGRDVFFGGLGDDSYILDHESDAPIEEAGEGTDTVFASRAHTLKANVEHLTMTGIYSIHGTGNELANTMIGNSGSNRMWGEAGNDTLMGNAGSDQLDGGTGNDVLMGGVGNDIYFVDSTGDQVVDNAGEGRDTVRSTVEWTLGEESEWVELQGTANVDATGNGLANVLRGNSGSNVLVGLGANDKIYAAMGDDTVDGGEGDDWLEGGSGRDIYVGGAGSDRFVFRDGDFGGASAETADAIQDFGDADGDRIHLSVVDANSGLDGNQAFAFIGSSDFTGAAGQLRYEQIDGNTYVQGDVDGDGVADFWIRLDGLHTLGTDDFIF